MQEKVQRASCPQSSQTSSLPGDDGAEGRGKEARLRAKEKLSAFCSEAFQLPGERKEKTGEPGCTVEPGLTRGKKDNCKDCPAVLSQRSQRASRYESCLPTRMHDDNGA